VPIVAGSGCSAPSQDLRRKEPTRPSYSLAPNEGTFV
jgi:hypothetical protein